MRYDRELHGFQAIMRERLKANMHKGDWKHESVGYLKMCLYEECRELEKAMGVIVNRGDIKQVQAIKHECADIGNLAMMIVDVSGGFRDVTTRKKEFTHG